MSDRPKSPRVDREKTVSDMFGSVTLLSVMCSACSTKFTHMETGKKLMKCPKCKAEYVLVRGEWHDKRFQDFLAREKRRKRSA